MENDHDTLSLKNQISQDKYIKQINSLIGAAVCYANRTVPAGMSRGASLEDSNKWSVEYHREMNRLAKKKGLRV